MNAADDRIVQVDVGRLPGKRPRHAGLNARLGAHGETVTVSIGRITCADGVTGFGPCWATRDSAAGLLGRGVGGLLTQSTGVTERLRAFEYPLWDVAGVRNEQPVYALTAAVGGRPIPERLSVRCYDTSLYFDDLGLDDHAEAAALIAAEAREGFDRGHRAFKIKIGRGARHMPLEAGLTRDIAIVHAVREAAGNDAALLVDANNGYNLNLTKRFLHETAACRIEWIEEPFHEDPVLYQDLKAWMAETGLGVQIADGEGHASPALLDWARDGLIDVVQYDIFGYGLTRWIETGGRLDAWGVRTAPHHYGGHIGNYVSGHLAGAVEGFAYVEWDEATTEGIDGSAYRVVDGIVEMPAEPGFGIRLDVGRFERAVAETGFTVRA